MSEFKSKYVVEYSLKGRNVHIHTVEEMLETNLRNAINGIGNDYLPVAIADSPQEAMEHANAIEAEFKKKGR